jgi:hypothetical protein
MNNSIHEQLPLSPWHQWVFGLFIQTSKLLEYRIPVENSFSTWTEE